MTTTTPVRVTAGDIPDIRSSAEHLEYITEGLKQGTMYPPPVAEALRPHWQAPPSDEATEPAISFAWETVCDEVAAELAPKVADLLTEAMRARMPWTWEPER